jgi:hypothetical protein
MPQTGQDDEEACDAVVPHDPLDGDQCTVEVLEVGYPIKHGGH